MKNKKIVVTGGAGFIGSNLVEALCDVNKVLVIDDLSTGHEENIASLIDTGAIEFEQVSILDAVALQELFTGVTYVFHEAAIPSVPRSVKDPVRSSNVNTQGTLQVLLAARDAGVKKVVFASSSSVYGDTPTLPKHEDMNPMPLSPYAVAKLAAEYYCTVFSGVYGLPTACLRYFNVFGPRQDPLGDYAAVIPKFISRLLHGESPVVYGDGLQTRDFTFVKDVVQANIKAAESTAMGVFNIACGSRIRLTELADMLIRLSGASVQVKYEDDRPGDIKHSLADISKAQKSMGYKPEYSLKDGLKETFVWFQKKD